MNPHVRTVLQPFAIGVGTLIVTFIAMMSSTPSITSVFTALLYLVAGFWLGRIQPKSLWFAPLLLNIPVWVIFIPMGMEIWPPQIHIWYFLLPPGVALPSTYVGMYLGARILVAKGQAK